MDTDRLIELDGVRFGYPGAAELFAGIDLAVGRGERVGLVGANGSGKTTLFHVIVGLARHTAGTLRVAGRAVESAADYGRVRREVGFLFQNSEDQLFCPTVAEDVAFGPLNLGLAPAEAEAVVAETLASLDLTGYADKVTSRLSGGEQRLVALATVLAMRPAALLLDEPAAGLDPRGRSRLAALLDRIGGTQVISSHDMEFVRATCRRVIVLDRGAVVADGPTDAVLGDAELMLRCGLERPYSLGLHPGAEHHDHRHGAGPSHGHGHDGAHSTRQHERPGPARPEAEGREYTSSPS